MNEHTLRLLSFSAIIEELKTCCHSTAARKLLDKQKFHTQRHEAEYALKLAVELRKVLESGKNPPQLMLPDIGAFIFRLKKQGTLLEPQELAELAVFIHSSTELKHFLTREAPPVLREISFAIPDLEALKREISRIIDPQGNILEKKVPALSAIRARIKRIHTEIERLSRSYLHGEGTSQIWQNDLPTVKDGRTVLALKAQFKGRVKGIVHEVSGSGATIFIEPQEIVEQNNRLVIEENNYKQEVLKLIRALSDKARLEFHSIGIMLEKTAFLDALLARVYYARNNNCTSAEFSETRLELYEARHPLLGKTAVPITVTMNETCQVLLITGPNTGGKTVSLKTVGLLALMHQFGMEIPVREGSVLPVFDLIAADIGDEQSIEQSLSTFSSHMTTIAGITARATGRSLVLLDELGAGTDPEEGTAIAMAILDFLIQKGSRVIATTHHGILKNYGYIQPRVTNASVDFDPVSLTPTYKLIMGLPGESHALVIAARNGLGGDIITRAKGYLNDERTDISRLIVELSRQQKDLIQLQEQQRQKQRLIEEKLKETERKEQNLQEKEYELRVQGLQELNTLLSASRKELERVIKEIRENHEIEANIEKGREVIGILEAGVALESGKLKNRPKKAVPGSPAAIGPGMTVVFKDSGKRGTVVRSARGGGWVVETDNARITVPAHELEAEESVGPEPVAVSISRTSAGTLPVFELNVRGFRLAQAMRSVEKQLDAAVVQGISSFTILHGKGHGILQQGIHDYLKQNPYVREYHFARPEEGGSGKTIVILKT
jgi:DNA mismatch repair protein MutS2